MAMLYPLRQLNRVYCAGPLFNEAERQEMLQIAAVLRAAGFEPFVPHADGMEFADVLPHLAAEGYDPAAAGQLLHEAVFALDVYQVVVGCGALVFNMNGRVPDEGAVAEATMAFMLGKPMVLYKDDARSKIAGRDNPLIVGQTNFQTATRLAEVPAVLRANCDAAEASREWQTPCPAHLCAPLKRGQALSERLLALGAERPAQLVAEIVLDLFGTPVLA